MRLAEIFGAGFWVASVIKVAGSSYEAFMATYVPFAIGGTTQPAPIVPNTAPTPGAPKNKHGQFLSPPQSLVQPVINAVQNGAGAKALAAWLKVVAWTNTPGARAQGWNVQTLVDWLGGQGWFPRFYDLTGWTPKGISHAGR